MKLLPVLISNNSILSKIKIVVVHRFIPIRYSGYWNVPNSFLTAHGSQAYLFNRYGFDDELDDYPPNYEVYLVSDISLEEVLTTNRWFPHNYKNKEFIGEIPSRDVIFDSTNRKFVNTVVSK